MFKRERTTLSWWQVMHLLPTKKIHLNSCLQCCDWASACKMVARPLDNECALLRRLSSMADCCMQTQASAPAC